jgi:hypothetical protein
MQASLVFLAAEIRPPQLVHRPVVRPEEEAHRSLNQIRHKHVRPESLAEDILWGELHERWDIIPLLVKRRSADNTYRDQNAASKHRHDQEYVPYHPREAKKDDRIQAYLIDQVLLFDILDGSQPTKWRLAQWYRSMFLVGMFGSGRIHARVSRSKEAEDDEQEAGDDKGVNYRGVDRVLLDLGRLVWDRKYSA